jgi:drug/metabolite transporter (DMT)-like permease
VSGVFLAGHFLLWTASLKYTSVAASVLLVSLHPIIVTPLGKRLLGERVSRQMLAGVGLAVVGTFVTCAGDLRVDSSAFGGDLLAIAGGLCLAGYLLIGRSVRADLGVAGYSAIVYAVVCVIAALTAVVGGAAHLPSPRVALACFGLALVCTIGGHTVYNWALRHVPVLLVSVSFLGEPPLTAVLALLILASVPSLATVLGGVLILAGLALALVEPGARSGRPGDLAIAQ